MLVLSPLLSKMPLLHVRIVKTEVLPGLVGAWEVTAAPTALTTSS